MNNLEVGPAHQFRIDSGRLQHNLMALSQFGKSQSGGINRSLGSQADLASRQWITHYWQQMGLQVEADPIANIWGLDPNNTSTLKPIVIGSHNDSVPEGGMFDGALGVLMATEVMQTILEAKVDLKHPLKVISLTGEEPNPYQISTLGSKVLTGIVTKNDLMKLHHLETGEPLSKAINRLGGNFDKIDQINYFNNSLAAFIECHIEQGARLDIKKEPAAAVDRITGIYRELVTIKGEANHAGTTMMSCRKDALIATSEIDLALKGILSKYTDDSVVGTLGFLEVKPNAANIIPGETIFNLDIRSGDFDQVQDVVKQLDAVFKTLESQGFQISREVILNQKPKNMDAEIIAVIKSTLKAESGTNAVLTSMAGHDAANMGRIGRTGMIFVRSIGGKSHCSDEFSRIEDIEVACNVYLQTILELDKELN
ncbi:Zn-dependent hydrolase [Agrilactobacillus composti]|nr:Zn-dependent hydrolase [Agrilactobacillus composti]